MRLADVDLRLRCDLAVGAVLDDLFVELDGLVHRGEERNGVEELEPLSGEEAVRNRHLPQQDFVVIRHLGVALDQLLVGFEGRFILAPGFMAAPHEVLRLRREIGELPDVHRPPRGLHGQAVVLLVEGFLRHFELILRARARPLAALAEFFVAPAFARREHQRRRTARRERHEADGGQHQGKETTIHVRVKLGKGRRNVIWNYDG